LAAHRGFQVPEGGARSITAALLRRLSEAGGGIQVGRRVTRIIVRQRRAVAVRTVDGTEIAARRAILADVGVPALYRRLLGEDDVPGWVRVSIDRFRYG